jgi:hypothetical protein
MKITSKAQARYLHGVAAGGVKRAGAPAPAKAAKMLRENAGRKIGALPDRAPARPSTRSVRRVSTRGRR